MTKRNFWIVPALMLALAAVPGSADAQSYAGADFTISVVVDGDYCATGGIQCEGLGAPADGTSGRFRVVVQAVKPDLDPLTSLTAASFDIGASLLPAGGTGPEINTSCPSCFQALSDGMYAIFLEPAGGGTWDAGRIVSQLEISVAGLTFYPLITLDIE